MGEVFKRVRLKDAGKDGLQGRRPGKEGGGNHRTNHSVQKKGEQSFNFV